jgi:hypothetical protein
MFYWMALVQIVPKFMELWRVADIDIAYGLLVLVWFLFLAILTASALAHPK